MPERPLLRLPEPEPFAPRKRGGGGSDVKYPSRDRQGERLNPRFEQLTRVANNPTEILALSNDPASIAPERAIVFEVEGALEDFYAQARSIGLEYLGDWEDEFAPSADFFNQKKPSQLLTGRIYLAMPNVQSLQELLSLWTRYKRGDRMPTGKGPWRELFSRLIDIRPWGPQDRILPETIQSWQESLRSNTGEPIRFEIELWFHETAAQRTAALGRVRGLVDAAGGTLVHHATIAEIHYDAALVDMPANAVQLLIDHQDVGLARSDEVMFLRPQSIAGFEETKHEIVESSPGVVTPDFGSARPIAALLDGLPVENHYRLVGRLSVDDPENVAAIYPVAHRYHGTEMASLILWGDLNHDEPPLSRPLHVMPVLRPAAGDVERTPPDRLLVDVIHQAVRRIKEGDGSEPATAPDVAIINISLGDETRPFAQIMSPLGRLIDFLSWRYRVLFLISAGNILDNLPVPGFDSWTALENATPDEREKAILSALIAHKGTRTLLSPAESLNALTIGALHKGSAFTGTLPGNRIDPFTDEGLPNVISAMGLGFKKVVKPDLLFDGGRAPIMMQASGGPLVVRPARSGAQLFGLKVACPSATGSINAEGHTFGTSAATALATRSAHRIYDALVENNDGSILSAIDSGAIPLILKALLVHGAQWTDKSAMLDTLFGPQGQGAHFARRDDIARLLGYGAANVERAIECAENCATMIGTGTILPGSALLYRIPLPDGLNGVYAFRSLTVTLAWFSPVNPRHQGYRMAALDVSSASDDKYWVADQREPLQPTDKAVVRGTIFHERRSSESATVFVDDGFLLLRVSCRASAGDLAVEIPYAMAVSFEVGVNAGIEVYSEVRTRLAAQVRAGGSNRG
jgi:hypothetical protein